VPFPNPEEKGALVEAITFSTKKNCDIILANDPDADRLGVAEYCKERGEWVVFTGDQIGTLLGHWLWGTIGKSSNQVRYVVMYAVGAPVVILSSFIVLSSCTC
jgi:phosphomannomutase